jgi:hypothetical protein
MLRKYYHREPIQSLKLVRFCPVPAATKKIPKKIAAYL